jgi:hypothetical protein
MIVNGERHWRASPYVAEAETTSCFVIKQVLYNFMDSNDGFSTRIG